MALKLLLKDPYFYREEFYMKVRLWLPLALTAIAVVPAGADPFFFSTGNPDGKIAVGASIAPEIEPADDFVLNMLTLINSATFVGLMPSGATVTDVAVEIYRVFPLDSVNPPDGKVPTRVNSP